MRAPDGIGKYGQYLYFKGEKECPTRHPGISYWWKWEQDHYTNPGDETFQEYIRGNSIKILEHWGSPKEDYPQFIAQRWENYLNGDV